MATPDERARLPAVLFDGACGFCRCCVALLTRLDRHGRLAYRSFRSADTGRLLASIPPARRFATVHLVTPDDRVLDAGPAVRAALSVALGSKLATRLLHTAPIALAVDSGYRLVAGRRSLLSRFLGWCDDTLVDSDP